MEETLYRIATFKSVSLLEDERDRGRNLRVTTAKGYAWDQPHQVHVREFETVKSVLKALKTIKPCHCVDCQNSVELVQK